MSGAEGLGVKGSGFSLGFRVELFRIWDFRVRVLGELMFLAKP